MVFNSGLSIKHSVETVEKEITGVEEVEYLLNFIRNSERGLARSCR
jgi:acyl-[acyl carrier protein]--UDP-N-acetylglucosamine O-acyltransferase